MVIGMRWRYCSCKKADRPRQVGDTFLPSDAGWWARWNSTSLSQHVATVQQLRNSRLIVETTALHAAIDADDAGYLHHRNASIYFRADAQSAVVTSILHSFVFISSIMPIATCPATNIAMMHYTRVEPSHKSDGTPHSSDG